MTEVTALDFIPDSSEVKVLEFPPQFMLPAGAPPRVNVNHPQVKPSAVLTRLPGNWVCYPDTAKRPLQTISEAAARLVSPIVHVIAVVLRFLRRGSVSNGRVLAVSRGYAVHYNSRLERCVWRTDSDFDTWAPRRARDRHIFRA